MPPYVSSPPQSDPTGTAVETAYRFCHDLTRHHAKTFYAASHFLPVEKRRACYAVYAFCRYVDDIVDVAVEDGTMTLQDARLLVEQWRDAVSAICDGHTATPFANDETAMILLAWEDTIQRYHIQRSLPEALIEGVLMDTVTSRYGTYDELLHYCYNVASVVGLMTSSIFGCRTESALRQAVDLGLAMQLTNIVRDVREDAGRGRIYIAQDDLARYGLSDDDILERRWSPAMRELIVDYVQRAETLYRSAESGIAALEQDSRMTVHLMSINYRRILRHVAAMDYNVFLGRARTSLAEKLLSIPRAWWASRVQS